MGKRKKIEVPFNGDQLFQSLGVTKERAQELGDGVASTMALAVVEKDVQAERILFKALNQCRTEGEKIFASLLVGMGLAVTKDELEGALKDDEDDEEEEIEEVPKNY